MRINPRHARATRWPKRRLPLTWTVEELDACFVVRKGELPGILKINLNQRKRHCDDGDNDYKGDKRQISGSNFFFALRAVLQL